MIMNNNIKDTQEIQDNTSIQVTNSFLLTKNSNFGGCRESTGINSTTNKPWQKC